MSEFPGGAKVASIDSEDMFNVRANSAGHRFKIPKLYLVLLMVCSGVLISAAMSVSLGILVYRVMVVGEQNMVLAEGKETFEKWKKTPIPVSFSVYLFNVTNPSDVKNGGRPVMQELGPFVFKQLRSKDILNWDHENKTVTYNDLKQYHFDPTVSKNLSEKIYSLNMPLQGIVMFARKLTYFSRSLLLPTLSNLLYNYKEDLFVYKTAEELIFKGYKVDLIEDLLGLIKPFVSEVPEILPNNTFGFLYGKNNSGDGVFTVYTGEGDISRYTEIVNWNNWTEVPYWGDTFCNMMNGTDGAQFPPPVTKRDILYAYTPELCRSVFLEYDSEVEVKEIPALRFTTPERLFATPLENADNMCYCTEKEFCSLSGILDLSPCRKGLKLAITGPHFFRGHPFFIDRVDGLDPTQELHDTYVDIEPTTGIVLRASRKLQINYLLEKFDAFPQTKDVDMNVIPLLWIAEEAELDDKMADLFTSKVRTPITVAKSVLTACIVLGILWIVTAGFVTVYIIMKQQKAAKKVKNQYKAVPLNPDEVIKPTEKFASVNT